MKSDDIESLQNNPSRINSNKFESPASSKYKLSGGGKLRKNIGKNLYSVILQQRQQLRVMDNDVDVTPKLLVHPIYSSIDEKQLTAFEAIGLFHTGSVGQLSAVSGTSSSQTSSSIIRTSSIATSSIGTDEAIFESLLSTQTDEFPPPQDAYDDVPPQFYLPT